MRVRVNGTTQPVRQPVKITYDPSRGRIIQVGWESAGNNLVGIANQYQALGIPYDATINARKSTLIASASGGQLGIPDLTADTWEILANEIQKNIWEHRRGLALLAVNPDLPTIIRDAIDNHKKLADIKPPLTGDAATMFNLLNKDQGHYVTGQYVIRHTTNVPNRWDPSGANVADIQILTLYDEAQLLHETTWPAYWIFPMPRRLVQKIENIAAPPFQDGYLWSWLKKPSTETTAAANHIAISTEYWLEQWSNFLYPISTAPA